MAVVQNRKGTESGLIKIKTTKMTPMMMVMKMMTMSIVKHNQVLGALMTTILMMAAR